LRAFADGKCFQAQPLFAMLLLYLVRNNFRFLLRRLSCKFRMDII